MSQFLDPLSGGERFILTLVSVVMATTMLIPITTIAFSNWRKVREREATAALVHDMLERGLSTQEIERVLAGAGISRRNRRDAGWHC